VRRSICEVDTMREAYPDFRASKQDVPESRRVEHACIYHEHGRHQYSPSSWESAVSSARASCCASRRRL
jgi:hypothetical protein